MQEQIFVFLSLVFLVYQVWRGWRLGLVRASLGLVALLGAGIVGWFGGMLVANLLSGFAEVAREFTWFVAGTILALGSYLAISIASMLLFKRTEHQSSRVVRFLFGAGGALCGLVTGVVLLIAVVSAVRAFGGLEEGKSAARAPDAATAAQGGIVGLKQSLESGSLGELVRKSDPIPDGMYGMIAKFAQVASNPQSAARMAEHPDIQDLLAHPAILELIEDPSFQKAAESGNFFSVMFHPSLLKTATDPDVAKAFQHVDLQKALDYALENPSTSPSPTP